MRLKASRSRFWRISRAIGVLCIAALCFLGPTTNASLWACATMAALSLIYFRQSR